MEKKFVASYSGGKDGAFAIYRAILQGMGPMGLITTFNTDENRSWFHGVPEPVLRSAAESIGVPLWLIRTSGDEYEAGFENVLRMAKEQGARCCVFGDIDIPEHIRWCSDRCANTGLEPVFPLHGQDREAVVFDFIDSGFTAFFTIIDTKKVSGDFLGKPLTKDALRNISAQGADICGEYGEYHTFVSDGPIFKKPIAFKFGEAFIKNGRAVLPVLPLSCP